MSAGDRWLLPDGREALELPGSQGGLLRVAPIVEHWPFPAPPEVAQRRMCTRLPSRYLRGQVPAPELEDALW
jgi:hypothetical protein